MFWSQSTILRAVPWILALTLHKRDQPASQVLHHPVAVRLQGVREQAEDDFSSRWSLVVQSDVVVV